MGRDRRQASQPYQKCRKDALQDPPAGDREGEKRAGGEAAANLPAVAEGAPPSQRHRASRACVGVAASQSRAKKSRSPNTKAKKTHRASVTNTSVGSLGGIFATKGDDFFAPLPYETGTGASSSRLRRKSSSRMSGKMMLQMLEDLATMDVDDDADIPSPDFDAMGDFGWGALPLGAPRTAIDRPSWEQLFLKRARSRHSSLSSNNRKSWTGGIMPTSTTSCARLRQVHQQLHLGSTRASRGKRPPTRWAPISTRSTRSCGIFSMKWAPRISSMKMTSII